MVMSNSRRKSREKKKMMISGVYQRHLMFKVPKARKEMRRLFHRKPLDIELLKSSSDQVNVILDKQQQKHMNVWKTKEKRLKTRMNRFQNSQNIVRDEMDQLEQMGLHRILDEDNLLDFFEDCMFTNMEIRILESKGITSYHQFIMDYTKQQLIEQIKEIPRARIRQVYHAVALKAKTPGAYQSSDSVLVRFNVKVETTTTSSIAVYKAWIATNGKERDQRSCMRMHVHTCVGIPVALCVCIGRLGIILHLVHHPLVHHPLGCDVVTGLATLGRGGVGCSPQTLQSLAPYLEEDGCCCFPHVYFQEEYTSMERWSWVEETKLKGAQIVYLLSRAHEGYEIAACAMWRSCTIAPSIHPKGPKHNKYLVSPDLLRITGETLLGIEKIADMVWDYALDKSLVDQITKKATCDEMLLLIFKKPFPLGFHKIKKLLKQSIKLPHLKTRA